MGHEMQRDLGAPIVAVSRSGDLVLQRGDRIEVLDRELSTLGRLPLGNPDDDPYVRYAVSAGARWVAHVGRSGFITVWEPRSGRQVARLDPGEPLARDIGRDFPMVGPAPETASSWGPPVFLEESLLASHHQSGVVLWELPSGRPRCTLTDPALDLARESFALGEGVAAVRCGGDVPGVHNALIFELSTADCRIRRRHLVTPAREPVQATGSRDVGFIVHVGGIRVLDAGSLYHARMPLDPILPTAVGTSGDGQTLLFAGIAARSQLVGIWRRASNQVAVVDELRQQDHVIHVREEGEFIVGYDSAGRVRRWRSPASGTPARVETLDRARLLREEAYIFMALDVYPEALRRLQDVAAEPFLIAYVESRAENESMQSFTHRVQRLGIRYRGEADTLRLAQELSDAEVVGPAVDMFLYWIDGVTPGSGPPSAVDVGLGLALSLSEADQHELQEVVLRRLAAVYPEHADVQERLRDLEEP
jgi:hypothetical protein